MVLMTTDTAGAYLAVSVRTIRDMIRRGDLPAIRIGNEYRIDENDIEKYIARNKTG